MWINAQVYEDLKTALANERTARIAAELQLAVVKSTEEWLRIQVNTLQLQNAEFINRLTNTPIPVPAIERRERPTGSPNDQPEWAKGALPTLEDPGDAVAIQLGIRHGSQGELIYDAS